MSLLRGFLGIALPAALLAALVPVGAGAQVVPSAYRETRSLWVGAEGSDVSASFPYQSGQRLEGVGVFADFNLNGRVGIEGDARFLHFGGFEGTTESSYLAGPRVFLFEWRRLRPYGKFLVGDGKIHYPFAIGDGSYLALAPGGGVEYRLSHRWTVRGEYEYQMWHDSPGFANEPDHELTPNGFHVGVAYRVFR
jgi:opacity protein-like surface antigen